MKTKYRVITRWKVRNNIHRSDLAVVLNKLTSAGWDIYDAVVSFGRFTVIAKRRVREKA